jgi:hypothetical protein
MIAILICYSSQIYELCHIFKGFISNQQILKRNKVSKYRHRKNVFPEQNFHYKQKWMLLSNLRLEEMDK